MLGGRGMTRYLRARTTRARTGSIATAMVIALLALGTTLPAAAKSAPPTRAPAPPPPPRCTQHTSHRTNDEWATCIGVRAAVSSAPAVGGNTTLTVNVTSDV